jgi:hypothetical protein
MATPTRFSLNIGQGVFSIQDDGPDAATSGVAVGTVTLDETRAEGTDTGRRQPADGRCFEHD